MTAPDSRGERSRRSCAGKTETLSISLSQEPLKLLRRRAAGAPRDLAMEVVADLVATHGPLTDAERKSIDTAFRVDATAAPRKKKRAA